MKDKISLVVGFIVDENRVLLIKKNRPEWQKGLYNGVGGAVKTDEKPLDAMRRETLEETGLEVNDWTELEVQEFPQVILHAYGAKVLSDKLDRAKSLTDESVAIFNIEDLPRNILDDVKLMIQKVS